jgi:hypothetical protein
MIELSAALVIVAALGTFVALRHQATLLELSKERSKPADALNAQVFNLERRLQLLEGVADRVLELEASRSQQDDKITATGVELGEALELTRQKYDTIITNGINECRELMAPLRSSILKAVPGGKKK